MNNKSPLTNTAKMLRSSAARSLALLPGSSIHFGPPRREATSRALDKTGLMRHSLIPARLALRPVAEFADPPIDQWMKEPQQSSIKEIYVAELPLGRYWGRFHGYIIDQNDTLVSDLSPTFTPATEHHEGLDQIKLPRVVDMEGTVAAINTLFGNNFHHWLLDTVPRFEWLRRAGWHWRDIDHFIFPKKLLRHQLETLALLGIDPAKTTCTQQLLHIRADVLVVPGPSEPGPEPQQYDYTPEGLQFVRDLFLTDNPYLQQKHPTRILISRERAPSRRLVQGERAAELLQEQGFTKILLEDYSLQEQAAMFHQAECIVMPTGGNLANLVFCQPGAIVVELFSKNYTPPFTHALMGKIRLRYYGLVAERISRPNPEARLGNEDIDIDAERIAEVVRHALSR